MYKLEGTTVVPCIDKIDFANYMSTANRRVAECFYGEVRVSTVFLGIDHNYNPDKGPMLFETMIFGGALDQWQWRYSTWEEAEVTHKAICKKYFEVNEN